MSQIPTRYQATIGQNINQNYSLESLIIQGPSKDAVYTAINNYAKTYHSQLTLDECQTVNHQIKNIQQKANKVINQLTDLWNNELKTKFDYLKTLDGQKHAEFSSAISLKYNQQIRQLAQRVPTTIELTGHPTANIGRRFSKKIRWRNTLEIINYLQSLSTSLNDNMTKQNIYQQLRLPFSDYLEQHPEHLQKYLKETNPEISVFYGQDALDTFYFNTYYDQSTEIEIVSPWD